jgi:hypothetical protein
MTCSAACRTAWTRWIWRCGWLRCARARAGLPGLREIGALETAALAEPKAILTPAEIRALAAEAIAHLYEVAGKLADPLALLGDDEAEGHAMSARDDKIRWVVAELDAHVAEVEASLAVPESSLG